MMWMKNSLMILRNEHTFLAYETIILLWNRLKK
jgi:hypothetical protein